MFTPHFQQLALVFCAISLITGCGRKNVNVAPVPQPEFAIFVSNETEQQVAVFKMEQKSSTRLGIVNPRTDTLIAVRRYLIPGNGSMRVYLFRGPEPCPVARMLNFTLSQTPRVTVTPSDTVISAYLPGDACRLPAGSTKSGK